MSSRSGSHAGRGFRYQDAIAAWLSVQAWTNAIPFGLIVPEGLDDVELRGEDVAFVQVKSRRAHLGAFSPSEAAGFVRALWERHDKASSAPEKLLLILERGIGESDLTEGVETDLPGSVSALLNAHIRAGLLQKTKMMVAPSPQEMAVAAIARQEGCTPLAAQLCYGELRAKVGAISDANGVKATNACEGLSKSDVGATVTDLLNATDPAALQQAVSAGLCEPVDFLTPVADHNFYLGVDVEPGHLAAGLVSERPQLREAVAQALEDRGNALVVGPSGAGKSAVMWEAARATRHSVRWFRVRRLSAENTIALRQLAKSFRASPDSPVGFVFDDVGRLGAEAWSQFARETPASSGTILLGSVREEDVFILRERARATEIRVTPDAEVAERMWRSLHAANQTKWEGWAEPWAMSHGLLLEYAFILTQGERMSAVLEQQVDARIADPERDDELAILRLGACAGAAGASLNVSRMIEALGLSETSATRALKRLVEEHVLSAPENGVLTGLHQLRSEKLLIASHKTPPPTYAETFAKTMASAPAAELEKLVTDGLLRRGVDVATIFAAANERVEHSQDGAALAAVLRGLSSTFVISQSRRWLQTAAVKTLVPTQITGAARFGITGVDLSALSMAPELVAAAEELRKLAGQTGEDPRDAYLKQLPEAALAKAVGGIKRLPELERAVAAFIGRPMPDALRTELKTLKLDFAAADLKELGALLGTLALVDRSLATELVDSNAEAALLARFGHEWPWVKQATIRTEGAERVVTADYWYVAQLHQPDVNRAVVEVCSTLLALIPGADVASSRALASNGDVAGFAHLPMANKRMARATLPAPAAPEWNRLWINTIAQLVAAESYSDYLTRAIAICDELVPTLNRVFDQHFRGDRPDRRDIDTLNALHARASNLTPPSVSIQSLSGKGEAEATNSVSAFQDVLFNSCANVVSRFSKLPDGVGAYIAWIADIIERVDIAIREEPWSILDRQVPASLNELREILRGLRDLAGIASVRNQTPQLTWHKVGKTAKVGNALKLVAAKARAATEQRLAERRAELIAQANVIDDTFALHVRDDPKGILPWPPIEILVLINGQSVSDILAKLAAAAPVLRTLAPTMVRLTIVPTFEGQAVKQYSVSGYEILLPAFEQGNDWLNELSVPILSSPAPKAFDLSTALAAELASLDKHGLGVPDRPQAERDARATIDQEYDAALTELGIALAAFDDEVADYVLLTLADVRTGVIDLGAGVQSHLSNGHSASPEVAAIGGVAAMLLEVQLNGLPAAETET